MRDLAVMGAITTLWLFSLLWLRATRRRARSARCDWWSGVLGRRPRAQIRGRWLASADTPDGPRLGLG